MYGKELILDLYHCDVSKFNRESITEWLKQLCELIEMERKDLHFCDYDGVPKEELPTEVHLLGTSAIQFISTSDIVIHTLDLIGECYINLFSCKEYDDQAAIEFTKNWFGSRQYEYHSVIRGRKSQCQL